MFPPYVDEHDCINCNSSNKCSNGSLGDICSITNNGRSITNMSDLKNRSRYVSGKTVIHNVYGGDYTFYSFPCSSCDPFGYTESAIRDQVRFRIRDSGVRRQIAETGKRRLASFE